MVPDSYSLEHFFLNLSKHQFTSIVRVRMLREMSPPIWSMKNFRKWERKTKNKSRIIYIDIHKSITRPDTHLPSLWGFLVKVLGYFSLGICIWVFFCSPISFQFYFKFRYFDIHVLVNFKCTSTSKLTCTCKWKDNLPYMYM